MSPALNGGYALQCFKCGNMVEICNGIMLDFYLGLPHTTWPKMFIEFMIIISYYATAFCII